MSAVMPLEYDSQIHPQDVTITEAASGQLANLFGQVDDDDIKAIRVYVAGGANPPPYVVFDFTDSRKQKFLFDVLADYSGIDLTRTDAFMSYVRYDDDYHDGDISLLRHELERAVKALTGRPFLIFQDVKDTVTGDIWLEKQTEVLEVCDIMSVLYTYK